MSETVLRIMERAKHLEYRPAPLACTHPSCGIASPVAKLFDFIVYRLFDRPAAKIIGIAIVSRPTGHGALRSSKGLRESLTAEQHAVVIGLVVATAKIQ